MRAAALGFLAALVIVLLVIFGAQAVSSMRITLQTGLLCLALLAFIAACIRSGFQDWTALGLLLWCTALFLGPRII